VSAGTEHPMVAVVAAQGNRLDAQQATIGALLRTVAEQHATLCEARRQLAAQTAALRVVQEERRTTRLQLARLAAAIGASAQLGAIARDGEARLAALRSQAMYDDDHYYQGHDKPEPEAKPYDRTCERCGGSGYDFGGESVTDCRSCGGRGWN